MTHKTAVHTWLFLSLLQAVAVAGCGVPDEQKQRKGERKKAFVSDDVSGQSSDRKTSSNRSSNAVESLGFAEDFGVLRVRAEMFESLAPESKKTLGKRFRRMHGHQEGAGNQSSYYRVRHILEQILQHPSGVSIGIRDKIKAYLKYLWLFSGNRHPVTNKRIRPTFIPGELGAATQIALRNGASIDLSSVPNAPLDANKIEQLEALLTEIRPYIFADEKNSSESDSVTPADAKVVDVRDTAAKSSDGDQVDGSEDRAPDDSVQKLSDGLLYFEDLNFSSILEKLNRLADYCDQKVREVGGTKSPAPRQPSVPFAVGHVLELPRERSPLVATNSQILGLGMSSREISSETGESVAVLWLNVNESFETGIGGKVAKAFSPTRSVASRRQQRRQLVSVAYHALRNLVGFGADGTEKQAPDWLEKRLGEQHALLRELRADLTALYLAFDSEVRSTGLIPDDVTRNALLDEYIVSTTEQIGAGEVPSRDLHLKARLMVVNHLIEAGVVTAKAKTPGHYQVSIADYGALRTPVIQLLGRVRNIRFLGDGVKAKQLGDTLGRIPPGWRDGLIRRFNKLDLPAAVVLLLPVIERQPDAKKNAQYAIREFESFFERNMHVASFAN